MSSEISRQEPEFLEIGTGKARRRIAVLVEKGAAPAIVWLGGFRSDMRATKAEALARQARAAGRRFIRFDYSGHGESGGLFAEGTISLWLDDALAVIAAFGGADPVLVGSSMGGWIALLAARRLNAAPARQRPGGLVLIAPATDFTEKLIWEAMSPAIRQTVMDKGVWYRESAYSAEPTPITRALIEDGRRHLLLGAPIATLCPVHILQGMKDPDVPWGHALNLVEHLAGEAVTLTLVKDGDHRLSTPDDIARLTAAVEAMAAAGRA